MKKALCQSIGIIGMWGLLTAYDLYILNLSTVNDATIHKAIRKVAPGAMLLIEDCDCVKATVSR
ncbi:MAG: hypothetical protein LRY75_21990, partial [Shewanella xiamenensis]|nr:hypothetical protein [Shewanella xiamenensis]